MLIGDICKEIKKSVRISRGMSGDEKYRLFLNTGEKRLLRVSDISLYEQKKAEFDVARQMFTLGVFMPQPLECSISKDGRHVYTLLDWAEGKTLDTCISSMGEDEQYHLGLQAGTILHRIHQCPLPAITESWEKRYYDVIEIRLEAFRQEGVPFEGSETILKYLSDNRYLLAERPQCRHHGDYHMGNLIVSPNGKLQVIDWHTVDFQNIGDPWYEFNRIGFEYPAFAAGQIDGYFEKSVADDFWILFNFYLAASSITSIVWAKYFAPDELTNILALNSRVLDCTDNLTHLVPKWYKDVHKTLRLIT